MAPMKASMSDAFTYSKNEVMTKQLTDFLDIDDIFEVKVNFTRKTRTNHERLDLLLNRNRISIGVERLRLE